MKRAFAAAFISIMIGTVAASAEGTGEPACDEYLREFHACIMTRTQEPERSEFLRTAELARIQYKKMLSNRFKLDVAGACLEARKLIFPQMSRVYGCVFK